jgi:adenosylhomocysteine nucleosidase
MRLALVALAACAAAPPRVVVLISANAEWKALAPAIAGEPVQDSPYGQWVVHRLGREDVVLFHGGYGKVAAAGSTQYAIDRWHPALLINLGTCGGFGDARVGDVVLASETIIYDIIEQMGDPDEAIADFRTRLDTSGWPARLATRIKRQPIASADRDVIAHDVDSLRDRFHVSVADWESGSIAFVAAHAHTPVVILRAVTDLVTDSGDQTYGDLSAFQRAAVPAMANLLALAADALPDLLASPPGPPTR